VAVSDEIEGRRRRSADPSDVAQRSGRTRLALQWALTAVATVLSAVALDLAASIGGLLLLASGTLDGASTEAVVIGLVATYAAWFAGLRTNVVANWSLLEASGTCTNLPSKALFSVARARSAGPRVRLVASAVGYVATEVVKEAPYYFAAFGLAGSSGTFDSTDALVFLAGTNLAAGLYEYGLARVSRVYLHRRVGPAFAR
jgi:hypothetical protein